MLRYPFYKWRETKGFTHFRFEGQDAVQSGAVKTAPGTPYYLSFVVDFDVTTEGRGLDATTYMYQGKLMPQQLFLSRK
jgi:hypothetical protein